MKLKIKVTITQHATYTTTNASVQTTEVEKTQKTPALHPVLHWAWTLGWGIYKVYSRWELCQQAYAWLMEIVKNLL